MKSNLTKEQLNELKVLYDKNGLEFLKKIKILLPKDAMTIDTLIYLNEKMGVDCGYPKNNDIESLYCKMKNKLIEKYDDLKDILGE